MIGDDRDLSGPLLRIMWKEFIRRSTEDHGYTLGQAIEQALDHFERLGLLDDMRTYGVIES